MIVDGAGQLVRKLVARGLAGAEVLPVAEQFDLFQAAAIVLMPVDQKAAGVAAHAATLLRDAERHQLKFRELLKS